MRTHSLVRKRVGECHRLFRIIRIGKRERINIIRISHIIRRSLNLLYLIAVTNRQIRRKSCRAVAAGRNTFDQSPFFHDHTARRVFNIARCIQTDHCIGKRSLGISIHFVYRNRSLLAVIGKRDRSKYRFNRLSSKGKRHRLALTRIIIICRCLCFFNHIGSKDKPRKSCHPVCSGRQPLFYKVTAAVHLCAVGIVNIRPSIDVVNSTRQTAVFIGECYPCGSDRRTGQHLALFVNSQFSKLFFIRYCHGSRGIVHQFHVISRRIDTVTGRSCNLLQIHRILCLNEFHFGFTVLIRSRHCLDQLRAGFVGINSEHCPGERITCIYRIDLNNLYCRHLNPGHRQGNVLLAGHTLAKHESQILRGTSGRNLISGIFLCDAALHL